jgi:DnaK suppressor protein
MTKSDVNKFRKVLEASAMDLDGPALRRDAIRIEGGADELDRVHRAAECELAVRNLEVVSAKWREARAALRRMKEGTYGVCLECDEIISPARLAAVPWAALCLRCQDASDCHCGARNARPPLALAA